MAKRRISTRELERRLCRRLASDERLTAYDVALVVVRLRKFALGYAFFERADSVDELEKATAANALTRAQVESAIRAYAREHLKAVK